MCRLSHSEAFQLGCVLFFVLVSVLGSRYGHGLYLRLYVLSRLKRLGYTADDLTFSFDKMAYAVTLPTNQPELLQAEIGQFRVVREYDSWVYPRLKGVRVMLREPSGVERLIAYLAVDRLWIPLLEKLLVEGKIDRTTYQKISAFKLMLPSTQAETKKEAFLQIRKRKFL